MTKQFSIFSFSLLIAVALCNSLAFAADPVIISCPGDMCDFQTIDNNGEMIINDTGIANNNTVGDTGVMTINNGGLANETTVNTGGNVIINDSGEAQETTIEGGLVTVTNGGNANRYCHDNTSQYRRYYAGERRCNGRSYSY